ncbi:hypothetical protein DC28_00710 [Spirochaeta lutea]|uniref:Biopolymer transporter ExbD n=1 Tax=Spirochaeta lutea TaxID=1480694 RepID=A0A098R0T7_9SPIO|nr:hypothetical protein DC28_00710 [Spirochaeta lutea]
MKFTRRLNPNASTDLIPMIDVVFQLVVFFLMSSTFIVAPGITLDLPQSSTTESIQNEGITVFLFEDGRLFIADQEYSMDGLAEYFSSGAVPASTSVIIEGESGVPYQRIISVLDILRKNGMKAASLRAETSSD